MKIKEVTQYLEERFPLRLQEDFDNCGVQCGDVEQDITGVLVCFEMTEKVIEEALSMNANLVISHHPLMLKRGICKIEPKDRVGRVICKALEHRMVLYSMHTNLDSAAGGGNDLFAEKLGLCETRVLVPTHHGDLADKNGLGRIGSLPTEMSMPQFLKYVKEKMDLQVVRYRGNNDKPIRTVAVCGGGGSSFIEDALAAGADAYVSGDIKYHDFFRADEKMLIADIGHYEGEFFIKEIIYKVIKEKFSTFAASISKMDILEVMYL
ncbi:MAG: Nif3-like dinuclear metal center hexameric protein [Bacteroidales bacterium]|nr:Nif3-like dinuclear metal center hexameric protein [Bacteroidales bacterium]